MHISINNDVTNLHNDGHELKPAISIFKIFIIISSITKLYPLKECSMISKCLNHIIRKLFNL